MKFITLLQVGVFWTCICIIILSSTAFLLAEESVCPFTKGTTRGTLNEGDPMPPTTVPVYYNGSPPPDILNTGDYYGYIMFLNFWTEF